MIVFTDRFVITCRVASPDV